MVVVSQHFLKSLPNDKKEIILKKLKSFKKALSESDGKIREIASGYWIRNIKNTGIYKFRLNNKDRILFTFLPAREENTETPSILFLKYVTHDKQILDGNNLNSENTKQIILEIDKTDFNEELVDLDIEKDELVINGEADLNEIPSIIVEDSSLATLADENNKDYLYYLSDEQYEPLKYVGNPIILSGAGGTGKTIVLLNKLLWCQKKHFVSAYISYTDLLVEDTKRVYDLFKSRDCNEHDSHCLSIKDLYVKYLNIKKDTIITYYDFKNWLRNNAIKYKNIRYIDAFDIWTEIRGIIKGYLGLEFREAINIKQNDIRILALEQYNSLPKGYSHFNNEEKEIIYKLTLDYQKWISNSNLLDENDLAAQIVKKIDNNEIILYDFIVVDEVQDLSEMQIYMISKLVKNPSNIFWGGDIHQTVNPTFFSFGRLKNLCYILNLNAKQFYLTKNYRSTKAIINLINLLSTLRKDLIGMTAYDIEEKGVRNGKKPIILEATNSNIQQLLYNIKDKHYCALIVADEEEKDHLIEQYNAAATRIFTVNEIKGLEYETIYCYNIISKHSKWWIKIFNGDGKRDDRLRFFFNLFYVAISRAKDFLCICESEIKHIKPDLFKEYEVLSEFDSNSLNMSKKSTKLDWEIETERLEKIGNKEKVNLIRDYIRESYIININEKIDKNANAVDINEINDYEKLLEIGNRLISKKDSYVIAKKVFDKAIEVYPHRPEAYYRLGIAYTYMFEGTDYAIRYFDAALKLKPDWYEVYLDKASSLRYVQDNYEVFSTLDSAISINNKIGNAYFIKGLILYEQNKYKEARFFLRKALQKQCYVYDSNKHKWNLNPTYEEEQQFKQNIVKLLNVCR